MRSSVGAEVEQLGVLERAELRRDGLDLHRADLEVQQDVGGQVGADEGGRAVGCMLGGSGGGIGQVGAASSALSSLRVAPATVEATNTERTIQLLALHQPPWAIHLAADHDPPGYLRQGLGPIPASTSGRRA